MSENLVSKYRDILSSMEKFYEMNTEEYKKLTTGEIVNRCNLFYTLVSSNKEYINLFLNRKIKLFSSKNEVTNNISNSLFGEEIPIKSLLNNQENINKLKIWSQLYHLYFEMETMGNNNSKVISILELNIEELKKEMQNEVKSKIIDVDVNESTNDMIGDIVNCFQDIVDNEQNPFENIMNVTTKISEKYFKDISDGNIEIDKIMSSISTKMPGMEKLFGGDKKEEQEPVVIDETFSTADVDVGKEEEKKGGFNIGNMLNATKNLPNIGNLMNIVGDINNAENEEDMLDIKNRMDTYLSSELNIDMSELNEKMEGIKKSFESKMNSDVKYDDLNEGVDNRE